MNEPVRQEQVEQLTRLLRQGLTVVEVCKTLNVRSSTFYYLKKSHPELRIYRIELIINRLIATIKEHPDWNNQEICDHCEVNITSFYKYLKKSHDLYQARAEVLIERQRKPHFISFYEEQLYKAGYTIAQIKEIIRARPMNQRIENITHVDF